MIVTITSLRLKRFWGFFKLSWYGFKINKQARREKGFVKMKNTGFGKLHYTISQWQSEDDLKRFARSGAHLKAMKESSQLASEIITYSFPSENFPSWGDAKVRLQENGKRLEFK